MSVPLPDDGSATDSQIERIRRPAIELRKASRVTITGNTIYDSADLSVFAAHSAGIVLKENAFVWRGQDSEPTKDGRRIEDCDNVLLSGLAMQRFSAVAATT